MSMQNTSAGNDLVSLIDLTLQTNTDALTNEMIASGMMIQKSHPNNTGDTQRFEEFDAELYSHNKSQAGNASIFKTQIGYSIDAPILRKAVNVEYTYEFKNYDKHDTIKYTTLAAIKAQMNRFDLDLQHLIGFATATSYTDMDGATVNVAVGDGLALASTVHTLRGSTSTFRSRVANNPQYSTSALELAEQTWNENCLNHFGQKQYRFADIIFSTDDPITCNAIRKDLMSQSDVTGLNSGVYNPYKNSRKHVVLSKVATTAAGAVDTTKRKYWGLTASGNEGWQAYYAINEAPHRDDTVDGASTYDVLKDIWSIPYRIGYSKAVLSGRYFLLSTGDAAA